MPPADYGEFTVVITIWILTTVDTILVVLRLWVRLRRLREPLIASDYFILISLSLVLSHASVSTWFLVMRHRYAVPASASDSFKVFYAVKIPWDVKVWSLKSIFIGLYLYYVGTYVTKITFLAFYYTLYLRFSSKMRGVLHAATAFVLAAFVTNIVMHTAVCRPVSRNWSNACSDPLKYRYCSSLVRAPALITATFTNVATDLMLMAIPIVLLRTLHIQRGELIAFCFVVSVGSLSILASLMRFSQLWVTSDGLDYSHVRVNFFVLWNNVDLTTCLAAACLPAFRVFLRRRKGFEWAGRDDRRPDVPMPDVALERIVGVRSLLDSQVSVDRVQ